MSALRVLLLALTGTVLAACHVGPQIDDADPYLGRQPQGAQVIVNMNKKADGRRIEYHGELLDVRDDGLVVLAPKNEQSDASVVLVLWSEIYRTRASELPGFAMRTTQGGSQRKSSIEELRNVSRFPQGLSARLTEQLLAHYGQTAFGSLEGKAAIAK